MSDFVHDLDGVPDVHELRADREGETRLKSGLSIPVLLPLQKMTNETNGRVVERDKNRILGNWDHKGRGREHAERFGLPNAHQQAVVGFASLVIFHTQQNPAL